jgi:hypothetical protein
MLGGLAAAGTAVGLVETARLGPHGLVIPALHDAANDRPISFTPVCGRATGVPVCLNPAYGRYLDDVTAALQPVLSEVAGLPGAPARASQVPGIYAGGESEIGGVMTIKGRPPVLRMPIDAFSTLPGSVGFTDSRETTGRFAGLVRVLAVHAFVGAGPGVGTPAQQALQAALLQGAGVAFAAQPRLVDAAWSGSGTPPAPAGGAVYAAARRLAALPPAARHAWLTAQLGALRSGQLTLGQLP